MVNGRALHGLSTQVYAGIRKSQSSPFAAATKRVSCDDIFRSEEYNHIPSGPSIYATLQQGGIITKRKKLLARHNEISPIQTKSLARWKYSQSEELRELTRRNALTPLQVSGWQQAIDELHLNSNIKAHNKEIDVMIRSWWIPVIKLSVLPCNPTAADGKDPKTL